MKLTIQEPHIEIGKDGFEKGSIDRTNFGRQFTELVDKVDGPLVVALDGGWGSGKSLFLKMWAGAHRRDFDGKAKIIYFDAFEHDFLDDPLISLVGAISSQAEELSLPEKAVKGIRKVATYLAKPVSRIGLAMATGGITEVTGPLVDAAVKKSAAIFESEISEFWDKADGKREAMKEFGETLRKLTKTDDTEEVQKIVFIIDELDRCRPDYALAFLETIKHFFAVPNVHFILGVNLPSLQYSIKARYGQDIDAAEYLKKFINVATKLPAYAKSDRRAPHSLAYLNKLIAENSIQGNSTQVIIHHLEELVKVREVSFRDVERIYTKIVLFPRELGSEAWGYQHIVATGLILNIFEPEDYAKAISGQISIDDIGKLYGYETDLKFRMPNSESGNRSAYNMYCLWVRALHGAEESSLKPEIASYTEKAFGHWGDELEQMSAADIISEYMEIWTIGDDLK